MTKQSVMIRSHDEWNINEDELHRIKKWLPYVNGEKDYNSRPIPDSGSKEYNELHGNRPYGRTYHSEVLWKERKEKCFITRYYICEDCGILSMQVIETETGIKMRNEADRIKKTRLDNRKKERQRIQRGIF